MLTPDIPFFGDLAVCLILVSAAYTLALSLGAASGRAHLLVAARAGTFATCGFVLMAVAVLAYAFQTHDFRITYVARYSDRSMPWWYLVTSLWGGQDGSLLWWTFLMSGYTAALTVWMRGRYVELQPYVLATLMGIFLFFGILLLFPANPFATYLDGGPADGEGLNPLLQNYWMAIHPPSLYMGFVGWSVPFSIVFAALLSGRLDNEWVHMARPWAMVTWAFLSLGLLLGCLWSYEELGWGGYWAWDPVENASFMPWLTGTAYLHSALIQERRSMLKVWNVFLICLTFFMTIFGTFLTRSGLIASVHAFAQSDIGTYFVWFMVFLAVVITAAILYRLPKLVGTHRIESMLSREFAFLVNNWILLGMTVGVLGATLWPKISDFVYGEEATVGPPFFNEWMTPLGLALLFLAGLGPLIAWRKASGRSLLMSLRAPAITAVVAGAVHALVGGMIGRPAIVNGETIYGGGLGAIMGVFHDAAPLVSSVTCGFVAASIVQEFARGAAVRMRKGESLFTALFKLVARARRRYGGYVVHLGIVFMFVGFTGAAYDRTEEAALLPGGTMDLGEYDLQYEGPRREVDPTKQMIFTDMLLTRHGAASGQRVSPAKFIYRLRPEMPTTEVAIHSRPSEDLYVIMATVDPQTRRATFQVKVRPLVWWIWFGGMLVLLGCVISLWPRTVDLLRAEDARAKGPGKRALRLATTAFVALLLAFLASLPAWASAQADSSSLHAGTVVIHDDEERQLFHTLLCDCGSCERLALDTCACSWAEDKRAELRARMAAGEPNETLIRSYRAQYGDASISIPSDEGSRKVLWVGPLVALVLGGGAVVVMGRRWQRAYAEATDARAAEPAVAPTAADAGYESALEDELRRHEDES
ncbi:MAG: cytochrome c biogenesis protein CcsA [Myxococcales bacterium]|nr:cytochrome c biogenesis protein CcsA [Myxococcales bacterium]MCB9626058.1 cytochrome c biogenesis protein CcsA [Sandaracinaceae bacterium]